MFQDLIGFLVANQLWAAGIVGTLLTTFAVRQGWLPSDKARVIAAFVAIAVVLLGIRLAGGVPSPDLLDALPAALEAILAAFGIALPVAGGAALAFRVAKTQPPSE